jgi:NADH-quinone oxidoreductase subunit G
MTRRAIFPPGEAREDWAIIRALSDILGQRQPWNTLAELRSHLYKIAPQLVRLGQVTSADPAPLSELADFGSSYSKEPFSSAVKDFYLTNPIARASRTMGECSALRQQRHLEAAE